MTCIMRYEVRETGTIVFTEDVSNLTFDEKMVMANDLDKIYPPNKFIAVYKYINDEGGNHNIHNFSNN